MTWRASILTVVFVLALTAPGASGDAPAAAIPSYFEDEWVGFLCLTASPPGSGSTGVLVQFNFDKSTLGGIPLARADRLFAFFASNLGLLSPTIGKNPQTTCSLSPTQTLAQFPGATALQAAQQVSGSFQQLGFSRYVIVDSYVNVALLYFGPVQTVRSDVFPVSGNNDLSYAGSNELPDATLP